MVAILKRPCNAVGGRKINKAFSFSEHGLLYIILSCQTRNEKSHEKIKLSAGIPCSFGAVGSSDQGVDRANKVL